MHDTLTPLPLDALPAVIVALAAARTADNWPGDPDLSCMDCDPIVCRECYTRKKKELNAEAPQVHSGQ